MLAEEPQRKKRVSEEKTREFIGTFKGSDSVVEQLQKLSTQISISSLLLYSEAHRDLLVEVLNESYVPEGVTMKELKQKLDRLPELIK